MAHPEKEIGSEDRDGRAQQHAEGKRPTLVLRGENEKYEYEREAEDDARGNALGGLLLLERHAGVVVTHVGRHGLGKYFLQRLHSLAGTVAGSGGDVDLGGLVFVVAN